MNREFQPAKGRAYLAMLMLGIMVAVMVVRIVFAVADPADVILNQRCRLVRDPSFLRRSVCRGCGVCGLELPGVEEPRCNWSAGPGGERGRRSGRSRPHGSPRAKNGPGSPVWRLSATKDSFLRISLEQPFLGALEGAQPVQIVQASAAAQADVEELTHHLPGSSWRVRCPKLVPLLSNPPAVAEGGGEPPDCSKIKAVGPPSPIWRCEHPGPVPGRWPRRSGPGTGATERATVLSPGASAPGTSCRAHHPRPTATAPSLVLSPSYPSPSPLSLLPVLQLYLPDSSRRKCGFHLGFGLAFYAGLFAAGVAFVVWNYRASRNLAAIGAPGQVATPVWTVAFWLAPVFFSYFAMREMWKGSRPEIDSENLECWTEGPGSRLVNFWWGAWIVTFYVGFVVRLVFIGRGWNVDRVVLSGWTSAAFDCIFVACLVLGIVLVWRIRSNQGRRYLLYRELIEAGTIVENRESGKEISGDLVASAL